MPDTLTREDVEAMGLILGSDCDTQHRPGMKTHRHIEFGEPPGSPTMPDTQQDMELRQAYERGIVAGRAEATAHIDTLTAAVENAHVEGAAYAEEDNYSGGVEAMRKVAADILRGEQEQPEDPRSFSERTGLREPHDA